MRINSAFRVRLLAAVLAVIAARTVAQGTSRAGGTPEQSTNGDVPSVAWPLANPPASPIVIGPIVQQAYLKASNTDANDGFSEGLAISGDTIAIGAPGESSAARGINGDQASNAAPFSGAVYVFVRAGSTWTQQAYLKASNADAYDQFGVSVALSGDTLIVGAVGEDSSTSGVNGSESDNSMGGAGAAYVFVRTGTTWAQQAYLKASNPGKGYTFGNSLAVSGDVAVIGALHEGSGAKGINGDDSSPSAANSGAAYAFVRDGTTWTQQAYLKASNADAEDLFGRPIRMSGDTVAIGAWYEASKATGVNGDQADNDSYRAGAVYVFTHGGTSWTQEAYLKASNTDSNDRFGSSVSVSGDTLVVGAYGESSNATGIDGDQSNNTAGSSGAAYVFVRSGSSWSQQAYLKASNGEASDQFGVAALAGDVLVLGAIYEDSHATGIDGDSLDNSASDAGAAYVFVRENLMWTQQAYLKASNAASGAFFYKTAMSAGTLVIGAIDEDSAATGVDGNQIDHSAGGAGAAYVFTGLGLGTTTTSTTTTTLEPSSCSQPITTGAGPKASDCLFILRAAVGSSQCAPVCVCDTNGGSGITASDALLCLRKAVGQSVVLNCPCL